MEKRKLVMVLAIAGEALAAFPILATLGTSLIGTIASGGFLFDWLMPAELFMGALAGGVLLAAAALMSKRYRAAVLSTFAAVAALFSFGQAYAVLSGAADGASGVRPFPYYVMIASVLAYTAALLALNVFGALLIRSSWKGEAAPN
jgi:hypothetical protein